MTPNYFSIRASGSAAAAAAAVVAAATVLWLCNALWVMRHTVNTAQLLLHLYAM